MTRPVITERCRFAFMAWRRNPERDPRFRLQSEEEATSEAIRLAAKRPGSTYLVLREVCRVTSPVPAAAPARSVEPGGNTPPPSGSIVPRSRL